MVETCTIQLLVDDPSVLAALRFSLSIEGFRLGDSTPEAFVIDERYGGDGVKILEEMRAHGDNALAIVIATHPSRQLRNRIASCDAVLVEKPLMGDEISRTLTAICNPLKVA
ncbi:histidine kinase [Novosphingopyxis iocasae]|uniref:histidine kinase n=1 Tax=Novosphingopyxis iocasae TaxID=2762729 RepID=UPI0016510D0F|nr:histidine kinase [Novosphingopyxis iocasae]